jgi:hypothetical protein
MGYVNNEGGLVRPDQFGPQSSQGGATLNHAPGLPGANTRRVTTSIAGNAFASSNHGSMGTMGPGTARSNVQGPGSAGVSGPGTAGGTSDRQSGRQAFGRQLAQAGFGASMAFNRMVNNPVQFGQQRQSQYMASRGGASSPSSGSNRLGATTSGRGGLAGRTKLL